jgi:hypothetical protein
MEPLSVGEILPLGASREERDEARGRLGELLHSSSSIARSFVPSFVPSFVSCSKTEILMNLTYFAKLPLKVYVFAKMSPPFSSQKAFCIFPRMPLLRNLHSFCLFVGFDYGPLIEEERNGSTKYAGLPRSQQKCVLCVCSNRES